MAAQTARTVKFDKLYIKLEVNAYNETTYINNWLLRLPAEAFSLKRNILIASIYCGVLLLATIITYNLPENALLISPN